MAEDTQLEQFENLRNRASNEGGSAVLHGIQALEHELTATESSIRRNAVAQVASLVEAWANGNACPDETACCTLATFFATRITDLACAQPALEGASAVCAVQNTPMASLNEIATGALRIDAAVLAADGRAARLRTLTAAQKAINKKKAMQEVQELDIEWHITAEVRESGGRERDPRAALALLKLANECCIADDGSSDAVFDAVSAYFPAAVSSGPNSSGVQRNELARVLEAALARSPHKAIELASEELRERENVADALSLLVAATRSAVRGSRHAGKASVQGNGYADATDSARAAVAVLARIASDGTEEGAVHYLSRALSHAAAERAGAVLHEAPKYMRFEQWESRARLAYAAGLAGSLAAEAFVVSGGIQSSVQVVSALVQGAVDFCSCVDDEAASSGFQNVLQQANACRMLLAPLEGRNANWEHEESNGSHRMADASAKGVSCLIQLGAAGEDAAKALAAASTAGNTSALEALENPQVACACVRHLCEGVFEPYVAKNVTLAKALSRCALYGGESARQMLVGTFFRALLDGSIDVSTLAKEGTWSDKSVAGPIVKSALLEAGERGHVEEECWTKHGISHDALAEIVHGCVNRNQSILSRNIARLVPTAVQADLLNSLRCDSAASLLAIAGAAPAAAAAPVSDDDWMNTARRLLKDAASNSKNLSHSLAEAGGEIMNVAPLNEDVASFVNALAADFASEDASEAKAAALAWSFAALARRFGLADSILAQLELHLQTHPLIASAGIAAAIDPQVLGGLLPNKAILCEQRVALHVGKRLTLAGNGQLDPTGARLALLRLLSSCSAVVAQQVVSTTNCVSDLGSAVDAALELSDSHELTKHGISLLEGNIDAVSARCTGAAAASAARTLRHSSSMAAREGSARILSKLASAKDAASHKRTAVRALRKALDDHKRRVRRASASALEQWRIRHGA